MRFKVGDIVRVISSLNSDVCYGPPALIVKVYLSYPKIFLYNEEENRRWLQAENAGKEWVYDIMYRGGVEEAVLGEWLRLWKE
jgi:hypothetical protein